MLIDADKTESSGEAHAEAHGGFLLKASLVAFAVWLALPVFGIGIYKNSSGDRSFDMWYPLSLMTIALVIMHEFIAPLPPKDQG